MKIALINNFYVRNYGSVLQSFALYKKLCNLGLDVVVVDYNDKPSMLNRIKGALILNRKAFVKKIISKIEKKRRTRQTLWRAVQMLTQKLSCQTIHDCPKVVPLHYESEWQ